MALDKTRAAVTGLMDEYAKADQARLWCDKSLVNLPHLPLIDRVFPNAKYICLYRHCLDFVHSYLSMSRLGFLPEICGHVQKSPHNVVAAIAEYWVERNSAIQAFERAHPGRCFRVNYESLASRPGETLTALFGFLGLEWDDSLLEKTFGQPAGGFAEGDIKFHFSKKIHTASIGGGASLPVETIPAPCAPGSTPCWTTWATPPSGSRRKRTARKP
uniref:sulfotransferase family protein n=1 Tax=Methylogaea oryzae TaxID=1295382 RepID=UPI00138F0109